MSNEQQAQLIKILSAMATWGLTHLLVERFMKETNERGLADDAKEALIKAGASAIVTIASSVVVRRIL